MFKSLPEKIIKKIVDEKTSEESFQIRVSLRSDKMPGLRIQKQVSGFKTESEADKAWPRLYQDCLSELIERESKGASFGAIVDAHELAFRRGELLENIISATLEGRIAVLRDWAKDFWDRPAKEVTSYEVLQAMHKIRQAGRSFARTNNFKAAVNRVYRWGIDTGQIVGINQSPAYGISLKREKAKKQGFLNEEEMKTLLRSAKEMNYPWYPVWAMALLTGMRNGELFAVKWSDIDFEKRTLSVTKSYDRKTHLIKSTKSGDWRTVPINEDLYHLLSDLKPQTIDAEFVLPRVGGWARSNQAVILKKFCMSIGLPLIRFHDLRACFATHLLRQNVPAIQVMKICGWEDLETMERYVRLSGIDVRGATDGMKILPENEIMGKVVRLSNYSKS